MKVQNHLILLILLILYSENILAQFGPIGYDFKDPYVEFGGLKFAVRLSTENNIYCPSPSQLEVKRPSAKELEISCNTLSAAGGQLASEGNIKLIINDLGNSRFSLKASGSHPDEKCKTILILIKGIDVKSMVSEYPVAKGVKEYNNNNIRVSYPSRSATMPLVFFPTSEKEWFVLSKDREIRKKGFACSYDHLNKEPVILISHDEDARKISGNIESPEWILGSEESRLNLVKERCDDLEKNFDIKPYKDNPVSTSINKIKLVVFFHGIHFTGHMFNTFKQMEDQLKWVCQSVDAENVMAFLPAWDGRYYNTYPEHEPEPRMGGVEGLREFVETAHGLGVKVVLMLGGPNLATFEFLEENDMLNAALKKENGFPQIQDWLDWNIDLGIETMGMIMNFGNPDYNQYMIDKTAELFDSYNVDGVFLDGTLRWENSPDYSAYEGLLRYTGELRKKYPDKWLMGEDGYDVVYGLFDMFHTSGGPLGLENFLLRYTRQFYYLSYPAENGSSGVHEIGWSVNSPTITNADPDYTVPSISLMHGDIDKYGDTILEKINKYKTWELKNCPIMD
jgi:hypothetical protein